MTEETNTLFSSLRNEGTVLRHVFVRRSHPNRPDVPELLGLAL